MLTIGQVLQNRYQITAALGHNSSGADYQAFDERLGIDCVVKALPPQPQDDALRFWHAASMRVLLSHPDLQRVTDYFQESGNDYLIMDLVPGRPLQTLIGNGLPEPEVLRYAIQLLDVLEYLQDQGMAHGDINPTNVIIDPGGRAVLTNLGVLPAANSMPAYAPPEQAAGQMGSRSDLYSLGATLYHALTGRAPTSATRRSAGGPLAWSRQPDAISPMTADAIRKALSPDPDKRFQSAAEFRAALGDDNAPTLLTVPVTATPGEPPIHAASGGPAPGAIRRPPPATAWRPPSQTHRRPRPRVLLALILALFLCTLALLASRSLLTNLAERPTQAPASPPPLETPATGAGTAEPALLATTAPPTVADTPAPPPSDTPPARPACAQGQADITLPAQGAVLRGTVPVMGTAVCEGFAYYKFEFVDQRCGPTALCFVAGKFTTPVQNGQLMNWDTTRTWDGQPMPNGTYVLRLTVVGQGESVLAQKPEITITIDNR